MEENLKNKLGFWVFIIVVIGLSVGGYFFTKYVISDFNDKDDNSKNKVMNYKIDKSKDYIYFTNEDVISEEAEIFYKDVVINLSTQEVLTESLKKENKIYKNTVTYIKDKPLLSDELIVYNKDGLYALNFREYKTYEFEEYVSLVIEDYNYTCFDDTTFDKVKSYVFNVENGQRLTEEEILNLYNQSMEKIKAKIRNNLVEQQTTVDEVELIKIDETLNDFDNYGLYINDYGQLYISYLVKTTQVDYNEIMEVN